MTSAAGRQYQQPVSSSPAAANRAAQWRTAQAWICLFYLFSLTPAVFAAEAPAAAPDFVLKSTQGDNLRLSEYRGQVVMLAFTKYRCRACQDQLRALNTLNKRYASQGLRILALSADLDLKAAADFAADLGLSFPILIDSDKLTTLRYQAELMPTLVLVDKDGKQRYVHPDYRELDEQAYESELRQLLSEWK